MKYLQPAIGFAALNVPMFAHAAAVDVSGIVTEITAQGVPIALIGAAVLLIIVGTKVFKWVRRAL